MHTQHTTPMPILTRASVISEDTFIHLATSLVSNLSFSYSPSVRDRRFRAHFGTSAEICSKLWTLSAAHRPRGVRPIHLLWALLFLKQYNTENVNAGVAACNELTFRRWCWIMVRALSEIEDLVSKILHREGFVSHIMILLVLTFYH